MVTGRKLVGGALVALAMGAQTAHAVNVTVDTSAVVKSVEDKTVIIMSQNGTLTVTEPGEIEVLLVGGGGGGGGRWYNQPTKDQYLRGGGGGGGGVIHKQTLTVEAGQYPVVIGEGGEVNNWGPGTKQGGDTTAFGLTAYGGGYGGMAGGRANASSVMKSKCLSRVFFDRINKISRIKSKSCKSC